MSSIVYEYGQPLDSLLLTKDTGSVKDKASWDMDEIDIDDDTLCKVLNEDEVREEG
jgi:hypothetical protein